MKFKISHKHTDVGIGKLLMDKYSSIANTVELDLTGNITIGKDTQVAHNVKIFTHKHKWNHSKKQWGLLLVPTCPGN